MKWIWLSAVFAGNLLVYHHYVLIVKSSFYLAIYLWKLFDPKMVDSYRRMYVSTARSLEHYPSRIILNWLGCFMASYTIQMVNITFKSTYKLAWGFNLSQSFLFSPVFQEKFVEVSCSSEFLDDSTHIIISVAATHQMLFIFFLGTYLHIFFSCVKFRCMWLCGWIWVNKTLMEVTSNNAYKNFHTQPSTLSLVCQH